jgi:hypothetical protein
MNKQQWIFLLSEILWLISLGNAEPSGNRIQANKVSPSNNDNSFFRGSRTLREQKGYERSEETFKGSNAGSLVMIIAGAMCLLVCLAYLLYGVYIYTPSDEPEKEKEADNSLKIDTVVESFDDKSTNTSFGTGSERSEK